MSESHELEKAKERLDAALRSIEDAVAACRNRELKNDSLAERIQSLEANLDTERQHKEKLRKANEEVSGRIDTVIASIDDILR